jgi:hypothetical protein
MDFNAASFFCCAAGCVRRRRVSQYLVADDLLTALEIQIREKSFQLTVTLTQNYSHGFDAFTSGKSEYYVYQLRPQAVFLVKRMYPQALNQTGFHHRLADTGMPR